MDSDDLSGTPSNVNIRRKRGANESVDSLSEDLEKLMNVSSSSTSSTIEDNEAVSVQNLQSKKPKCKSSVKHIVDMAVIRELFPHPKLILNNFCDAVARTMKNQQYCASWKYRNLECSRNSSGKWQCVFLLRWPEEMQFKGEDMCKASASYKTSLNALQWLYTNNKLTDTGDPIFDDVMFSDSHRCDKFTMDISVDATIIPAIKNLMVDYDTNISRIVNASSDTAVKPTCSKINTFSDVPSVKVKQEPSSQRNEELYESYCIRPREDHYVIKQSDGCIKALPIMAMRSKICSSVAANQVTVISGEPGCGKSTKIPQFIMDDWCSKKCGANCNIVISEPYDFLAISLAERVAYERNETIGDVVGYKVSQKQVVPNCSGGTIMFYSSYSLLCHLRENPKLDGINHIILDEGQMRDVNNDLLFIFMRKILFLNPSLKLIITTTSLNADHIMSYFYESGSVSLHIPDYTYHVKAYYLNDIFMEMNYRGSVSHNTGTVDCDFVATVIAWIDRNRFSGAILCFLPGWKEVNKVSEILHTKMDPTSTYIVATDSYTLTKQQDKLFKESPLGLRKVILTTEVGETAVTINDVRYVVDTGLLREGRFDKVTGVYSIKNYWISSHNVNQRRSRAGILDRGESYHLYMEYGYGKCTVPGCLSGADQCDHSRWQKYPIPEIHRLPLERLVLYTKAFCKGQKLSEFLSKSPSMLNHGFFMKAIQELIDLELMNSDESLTSLGHSVAHLNMEPRLAVSLIYAAALRCVKPVLTISTILNNDIQLFCNSSHLRGIRKVKSLVYSTSDHLALISLYDEWEKLGVISKADATDYSFQKSLSTDDLVLTKQLQKLVARNLSINEILSSQDHCDYPWSACNRYSEHHELIKGALFSGWNKLMILQSSHFRKAKQSHIRNFWNGKTSLVTGLKVQSTVQRIPEFCYIDNVPNHVLLSLDGVNSTFISDDKPTYAICLEPSRLPMNRSATCVRDTTIISPLTVFLFQKGSVEKTDNEHRPGFVILQVSGVRLSCKESEAEALIDLHKMFQSVLRYLVHNKKLSTINRDNPVLATFWDKLLYFIASMLHKPSHDNSDRKRRYFHDDVDVNVCY